MKKMYALKMVMIISILFFSVFLFSQEGEWQVYENVNGVEINFCYQECNNVNQGMHKEYVVFKFINTTANLVEVSYSILLWYDEKEIMPGNKENVKHIVIEPNQIFETSCNKYREYNIFSKFLNYNKTELTKFELVDIRVGQDNNTK